MEMFTQWNFRSVIAFTVMVILALLPSQSIADKDPNSLEQIERLRAEIEYHDNLYFRDAAPEITDYEYDLLKLELRRLEAGVTTSERSIGDDRTARADQVSHGRPMLSLAKAYTDDEVATFFDRAAEVAPDEVVVFSLEPKFDGVAVSVVLERGEIASAATRGNGEVGEDITSQVIAIRGLRYDWEFDTSIPRIERIELRGEVYLSNARFTALNAERVAAGQDPFRHPRSVAAGSIKLDDLAAVASRGLSIVIHGWGEVYPADAAPESVVDFQRWLERHDLPSVAQARFLIPKDSAELNEAIAALHGSLEGLPTDGIVIKVDEVSLQQKLGDGPTAPRWALARKFAPPRAETVLRDIVWQVGRTGALTPVAEFDPVVLGGATVRRASLSNAREVERRDLRLGDVIWIEKAGEIIPQVAGVLVEHRAATVGPYPLPIACPVCAEPLSRSDGSPELVCANYYCEAQITRRLLHFVSKDALQIRGMGPVMAQRLVESGLVRSPGDLYGLTTEQLVGLPGVGNKTAGRLLSEVNASREADLDRWIVGLGLPSLGRSGAQLLAAELNSLSDLLDESHRRTALGVMTTSIATEVEAYLSKTEVQQMLQQLAEIAEL